MGNQDFQTFKIYTRVADELESSSAIATYYLKTYTLNKAIEYLKVQRSQGKDVSERTEQVKEWLQQLETLKTLLENDLNNKEKCKEHYQNFTFSLFHQSDQEYLKGNYSRKLAKNFLYVSVLFDAWELVGFQSEHIKNKKAYANDARFKIMDALTKGQVPNQNEGGSDKRGRASSGDSHPNEKMKPNNNASKSHEKVDPLAKLNFDFTESIFIPQKVLDKITDEKLLEGIEPDVKLDLNLDNKDQQQFNQIEQKKPSTAQEVKNRLNLPMGKSVSFEHPVPPNNYPNGGYYEQPYNQPNPPENYQHIPFQNQYMLPMEYPQNPPSYYYGPPQNLYSNTAVSQKDSNFYAPYQGMPYYPEGSNTQNSSHGTEIVPQNFSHQQYPEKSKETSANSFNKLPQNNEAKNNQPQVNKNPTTNSDKLYKIEHDVAESVYGYQPTNAVENSKEDLSKGNEKENQPSKEIRKLSQESLDKNEKNTTLDFETPNPYAQSNETPNGTNKEPLTPCFNHHINHISQQTPDGGNTSKNLIEKYQPSDIIYETPGEKSESGSSSVTDSNKPYQSTPNGVAESLAQKVNGEASQKNSMYYYESENQSNNVNKQQTDELLVERTSNFSTADPGITVQVPERKGEEKVGQVPPPLSCLEAKKICLDAASELDFNRVKEAKEKILQALKLLEQMEMNQTQKTPR